MLKKGNVTKKNTVNVTFYTHKLTDVENVYLVGDFNDWDETLDRMTKLKDGRFKLSKKLPAGCEYQFRYKVDGEWHNEWEADKYAPNPFSGDNSVVIT